MTTEHNWRADGTAANRRHWDSVTPVHVKSRMYDVEGFLATKRGHYAFVKAEVGDVDGKRLLHLQCHFGMETLLWEWLGAEVTGLDFSEVAIAQARDLARRAKLKAQFIVGDVLDPESVPASKFDVVFTSFGVLCWLGDLSRWAATISRALKPGGVFHIFEFHPVIDSLSYNRTIRRDNLPVIEHPYFYNERPSIDTAGADYADPTHVSNDATYEWHHAVSEVMAALKAAGLRVTEFKEYPYTVYQARDGMVRGQDGLWRMPAGVPELPLTYYLRAEKP